MFRGYGYNEPTDYSMQHLQFEQSQNVNPAADYSKIMNILERDNSLLRAEKVAVQKTLDQAREDAHKQSDKYDELTKEVGRVKEAATKSESLKIAELQNSISEHRQGLRAREHEIAALKESRAADTERTRTLMDNEERTRRENDELRAKKTSVEEKNLNLASQGAKSEELVKLLEDELAKKKDRMLEQERLLTSRNDKITALDAVVAEAKASAAVQAKKTSDWETKCKKLEDTKGDLESKIEKLQTVNGEFCHLLGVTDPYRAGHRIADLQTTDLKLRQELLDAQQKVELKESDIATKKLQISSQTADIKRLEEAGRIKESENKALSLELTERTREVRTLTIAHAAKEREERSHLDQIARYQHAYEQREQQVSNQEKAEDQRKRDAQTKTLEARNENLKMTTEHTSAISKYQNTVNDLETQLRTQADYVDAVRRIGRLLCVDPSTTSSQHAHNVEQAVEQQISQSNELQRTFEASKRQPVPTSQKYGGSGDYLPAQKMDYYDAAPARYPYDAARTKPPLHRSAHTPQASQSELEYYKAQVLESEQRCVKVQIALDTLVHSLAKEHKQPDSRYHQGCFLPGTPAKGGARVPVTAGYGTSRSLEGPLHFGVPNTAHGGATKDIGLHKHINNLMQTIESQDKWIALLNARLDKAGGGAADNRELEALREEVRSLRYELSMTSSKALGLSSGATGVAGDVITIKQQLQDHIDFRSTLITALQMHVVSATNDAILRRIQHLVADVTRPTSLATLYAPKY